MVLAILGIFISTLLETTLYGVFAILVTQKSKNSRYLAPLISFLILEGNVLLFTPIIRYADLKIMNQELVKLLGSDKVIEFFSFDIFTLILDLSLVLIGYFIAKKVLAKIQA